MCKSVQRKGFLECGPLLLKHSTLKAGLLKGSPNTLTNFRDLVIVGGV